MISMQKNTKNAVQDLWLKGVIGESGSDKLSIWFDSRSTVLSNQTIGFHFDTFLTAIGIN